MRIKNRNKKNRITKKNKELNKSNKISKSQSGGEEPSAPSPSAPSLSIIDNDCEEQLQICKNQNDELRHYLDNVIAENNAVKNELNKFKTNAPPEFQVKSAGNVPYIKAEHLYKQLDDIGLDMGNLDSRLTYVATLIRKQPYFKGSTKNIFYKFYISPPPEEKMFTAHWQDTDIEIPFPAVLFLRCRSKDNKLEIRGVYVVGQNTRMEARMDPYEVDLIGLIKLETKEEYYERIKKNKPVTMASGEVKSFDLKIDGHEINITFTNPDETQISNLKKAIEEEQKSATGTKSNYALSRFNIDDVRIQKATDLIKDLTSLGPSKPTDVSKGVAGTALAATKFFVKRLAGVSGGSGKRRRNVKYKTKKMKYKKIINNRKTTVKME